MSVTSAGGSSTRRPINSVVAILTLTVASAACSGASPDPTSTAPVTADTPQIRALDLQGHRGARGLRPENTLPSFEVALDFGVTTLEMDLHLSADEVVVVWHDPVIDPDKCGLDPDAKISAPDPDDPATPEPDLMLSDLTAAEIAAYRCNRNPDADRFPDQRADAGALAGADYSIPTLDEVFQFVADYEVSDANTDERRASAASVQFNIETKRRVDDPGAIGDEFDGSSPGAFELEVIAAIERAGISDRVVIQSFDHRSLWAVHSVRPEIRLAALTRRGDIPNFADLAARGASIWSPDWRSVTPATLEAAHAAGLAVIPWTVNDPDDMHDLIELGVDGLITDRPDLVPGG